MSEYCRIIQIKRGSSSTFQSENPILQSGELAWEKDTNKIKVGDGITEWNDLPYLNNEFEINDVLIFKGTLGSGGTISVLPSIYQAGWSYKVITAGTYANKVCEVGDLIISIANRPEGGGNDNDWVVVQANIDGAVTSLGGTTNRLAKFSSELVIEDSVISESGGIVNVSGTLNVNDVNVSVSGHSHISTDISDSTLVGRSFLTAEDYASQNFLLWESLPFVSSEPFVAKKGGHYRNSAISLIPAASLIILDPPVEESVAGDFYVVWNQGGISFNVGGVSYGSQGKMVFRVFRSLIDGGAWETQELNNHTHTSNQITDFNSSVSGLLPTIANSGDNRILTSTGTSTGINAESNLIFDGSLLSVGGNFVASSGNFTSALTVNDVNVSVSGHSHVSSDITDSTSFGRNILTANSYAAQNKLGWQIINNNITAEVGGQYIIPTDPISVSTITITDPTAPSHGDWYVVIKPPGAGGFSGNNIIGGTTYNTSSGLYLYRVYSRDPGSFPLTASWKNYSLDKLHSHTSSDIIDFDSSVSGLLPSVSGSGFVNSSFDNNVYTISVSGLQPSGNYSVEGHTHVIGEVSGLQDALDSKQPSGDYAGLIHTHESSDITDFDASVSGLLPVKDVIAGSGIDVGVVGSDYTISVSGLDSSYISDFDEAVDDRIGSGLFVAGTGINLNYDDPGNSFTVSVSGLIDNPSDNRILTSRDSTTTGIDAENNLTFDNQDLLIAGNIPSISFGAGDNQEVYLLTESGDIILDESGNKISLYNLADNTVLTIRADNGNDLSEIISSYPINISAPGLTLNNINVSVSGHTHTASEITDFNASVSGLLPTIANSGDNRILTSDGTSTGINAESNLTFDGIRLVVDCGCPQGSSGFTARGDGRATLIRQSSYGNPEEIITEDGSIIARATNRTVLFSARGSLASPLPLEVNDEIFIIRGDAYNPHETLTPVGNLDNRTIRILGTVSSSGTHYLGSSLSFQTSTGGPTLYDNVMSFNHNGILSINNIPVSINGHTHTSSDITDFNSSVSGLLPTINNPGNDRLLTSDGSSYGIIAQDKIVFDPNYSDFGGISTSLGVSLTIKEEVPDTNIPLSSFLTIKMYGRDTFGSSGRIQFEKYRGTENSPQPVQKDDFLGTIRFLTPNPEASGLFISGLVARMVVFADDDPVDNGYTPTRLTLNTSSGGENRIDNNFTIFSDNRITTNCSLTVDEGLSSPTPIYSLGIVSGNTAISYAIDKQIQTLTLNGTSVNFTQGTGWGVANKSLDVILEITVNSTTTVAFDSNFITDVYNTFPVFIPGKYLVLLRSMGSEVVQAHYIGEKTN
jgi:hypothetical protein